MNNKFYYILLGLFLISSAYSLDFSSNNEFIFNAPQIFIYNSDLHTDTGIVPNINDDYYGWETVIKNADCYFMNGEYKYHGKNFACAIEQQLPETYSGMFAVQWAGDSGVPLIGVDVQVCLTYGNSSITYQTCKGENDVFAETYYFNMTNLTFIGASLSQTSSYLNDDYSIDYIRLYQIPTTSSYTAQVIKPLIETNISSIQIISEYYSSNATDNIKYYIVEQNVNYNTLGLSGFEFKNLDYWGEIETGVHYYRTTQTELDEVYTNKGFYYLNQYNNDILINGIGLTRLSSLQNFLVDYDSSTQEFTISFDEPAKRTDLLTGTIINTYSINLINYVSLSEQTQIKLISFNDEGWTGTGTKDFGDFSVERTTAGKLIITYYYFVDESITLKTAYYQTQKNNLNTYYGLRAYDYSFPDYKTFGMFEFNGSAYVEFGIVDSTNYQEVLIIPFVFGDNIEWAVQHTTTSYAESIIPDDYENYLLLNLSRGYNNFRFYDMSNDNIKEYTITYLSNMTLLNMSILDRNNVLNCYTNGSDFNSCNYPIFSSLFYIKSFNDEPYIDLDLIGEFNIETDIYCERNGTMELYYSDYFGKNNYFFVPSYRDDNINSMTITMNPKFSQSNTPEIYDYLLSNPDLINNNEYDFAKLIMAYVRTLPSENKVVFLPQGVNCYMEQSYYDVDNNKNSLNVSFQGSYSLLTDIRTSGIFFELTSSCYLDRFKNNNILDFANYYSCILTTFVSDNSTTFYYITFFVICIILSKVFIELFK